MSIQAAASLPAGSVTQYAGANTPGGWLLCYGQAVSRATYAALFNAIGTAFGAGDGSTTFNLPDARGRAIFGKDDMGGTAANRLTSGGGGVAGATLGAVGGGETVTLTSAEMPSHTHSGTVGSGAVGNVPAGGSTVCPTGNQGPGNTGGGGAHKNIPPALVANYIIKT